MRRGWVLFSIAAVGALGLAAAGLSMADKAEKKAEAKKPKTVTVTGVLVDTKCFGMMPDANRGNDHMTPKGKMPNCAAACSKMGIPVGLLTEKGDVYVLVAPASSFSDHMAKEARVSGSVVFNGQSIIPDKVEAKGKEGKWEVVEIVTMM